MLVIVCIVAVVVSIGAILILKSLSTSTQVQSELQQVSVSTQLAEESKWIGTYEYTEFVPSDFGSNQIWAYQLTISSVEGQLKASLDIDGFQTIVRITANAVERDGKLNIVFEDYGADHVLFQYERGNILFSLEKITEEKYRILWGELTSNLLDSGDAKFSKKEGLIEPMDTTDWQTYRNEEFGYVAKLPSEFEEAMKGATFYTYDEEGRSLSSIRIKDNLLLTVYEEEASIKLEEFKSLMPGDEARSDPTWIKEKNLELIDCLAPQFRITKLLGGFKPERHTFITICKKGDVEIGITLYVTNEAEVEKYRNIYDEVLSTLRIIEPTPKE